MLKLILFIGFVQFLSYTVYAASGSVELDEFSFDKIINKFEVSLVKFDVAFPYGDKHDAFVTLAKESKDENDLLFAEVGVKDYGEKDNEALAKKYGATKSNFPVIKLFLKGNDEPMSFDDSKGFTVDQLRRFVRERGGLLISLPGCIKKLDVLAHLFMKSDIENKKVVLGELKNVVIKLPNKDETSGKIYQTIMEKVIEKGDDFVKTENERLKKLISGKISDTKKNELNLKLNILQSFQITDKENVKTEL